MEAGFDKDFEEFVKEMEASAGDGTTPAKKRTQTRKVSQNTTDKFQELVASMRKDMTDDFWTMMKGMQADMETSFEGFMKTMEHEMDDNFDQMFQTFMGEDSRGLPIKNTYEEKFEQWKNGQMQAAQSRFIEYYEKRNTRSAASESRKMPARDTYEEHYEQWKNGQLGAVRDSFIQYSKKRSVRSVFEDDQPTLAELSSPDYKVNANRKQNSQHC